MFGEGTKKTIRMILEENLKEQWDGFWVNQWKFCSELSISQISVPKRFHINPIRIKFLSSSFPVSTNLQDPIVSYLLEKPERELIKKLNTGQCNQPAPDNFLVSPLDPSASMFFRAIVESVLSDSID